MRCDQRQLHVFYGGAGGDYCESEVGVLKRFVPAIFCDIKATEPRLNVKERHMTSPFPIGSLVIWSKDALKTWHFTVTPGLMKVISARWDDGTPSEYSMQFGGIPRTPGWIITIEFDGNNTTYYDPPLTTFFGTRWIQKEIHEKWLTLVQ